MRSSLARNFLLGLGAASVAFTLLAALSAFLVFQRELAHRQIAFLSQYVQERTANVDHRFSNVLSLQRTAVSLMRRRVALLKPGEADRMLDKDYPLHADGTRRTAPDAYSGRVTRGGRLIYGMGGFLADGAHIPQPEKDALVAAYALVSGFGQAAHGEYDNFYFYTPHNRMVIFGPDRPDHLLFYREQAPANLDFTQEEVVRTIQPKADPKGATRCTSLQRLIQDTEGQRVATACVTPAYIDGQLVGAFGSTLNLTSFFADAVKDTLPGASSLIVRSDGEPIAYPGSISKAGANEAQVAAYRRTLKLPTLVRMAEQTHAPRGVIVSPDHRQLVAFGRLTGPDWYLMLTYPAAAVTWSAARSASWILVLGLIASLLQTAVIVVLARRAIVRPLQALADSCSARGGPEAEAMERRRDEIGVLARALTNERARADELLASLERRVSERTAELERANAEKSRFLANMSHELRTPLNGVIAVSETLAREQVSPRNTELAQLIVSSGRLLEQVLTDILDFSKIEAGEMGVESRPFDLTTTVSRVAELHRASAEAKGIGLVWEVEPAAEGVFLGDAIRLTQVLSNLLSNAVKFTAQGQATLRVRTEAGALHFEVSDTGIGFDPATAERLFHRFEQADLSIRRRFGGTGLGLAICRSLVSLMGGKIGARSRPGEGATFCFDLPLARVGAEAQAEPAEEAGQADLTGLQVLLAEDHPTNQRVVRLILEAVGVELTVVENGALALEAFAQRRFDVVLMDMQMPELDGLSATAQLRAREAELGAVRTPVIMLTANALDEHVQASRAAGADLHLSKPLRAHELLDAIATVAFGGGVEQVEQADAAAA